MRLFVDDTRPYPEFGYECVNNARAAIALLEMLKFDYITLDYDLGEGCDTGLSILYWMKDHDIFVPEINIHSNHLFGVPRMVEFARENFPNSKITTNKLSR